MSLVYARLQNSVRFVMDKNSWFDTGSASNRIGNILKAEIADFLFDPKYFPASYYW